jgi:hypothetical protein
MVQPVANHLTCGTSAIHNASIACNFSLLFPSEIFFSLLICFDSFVDLPNLTAAIYSVELSNRLRAFLVACPPAGPASPVSDLVVATADFQKDLASWNIW